MRSVTDGELRRAWFHLDFLQQLDGVAVTGNIASSSNSADTVHMTPPKLSVVGPLRHVRDIQVDDFRFLASIATQTPKVSIPSPTMVHFRGGRAAIDLDAYPDLDVFFDDLAACYRAEIAALYAAGCRYIQLDDTNLAYLCDPAMRAGRRRARRRSRCAAPRLRRADQRVHRRAPRRSHRGDPPVPWQLPQHLVRPGRLRAGGRGAVQRAGRRRVLPRVRRRALRRLRPAALRAARRRRSCSGWSPPSGRSSSRSTSWPRGSTRPPPTSRSTGCASARSAASPARSRATPLTADQQWAKLALVVDTAARIWS